MTDDNWRSEFAAFLDRLVAAKGRVSMIDWDRWMLAHYSDPEVEEIRRTIGRLSHSWAFRDWPDFNLELAAEWAAKLRGPRET